jgi:hypothetical protein
MKVKMQYLLINLLLHLAGSHLPPDYSKALPPAAYEEVHNADGSWRRHACIGDACRTNERRPAEAAIATPSGTDPP